MRRPPLLHPTMDALPSPLLYLAASLLVGIVIGGLAARQRGEARRQATLAELAAARADTQVEMARLAERLQASTQTLMEERRAHATVRQQAEGWRVALDEASNTIARLGERAERVPTLELQWQQAHQDLQTREAQWREASVQIGRAHV